MRSLEREPGEQEEETQQILLGFLESLATEASDAPGMLSLHKHDVERRVGTNL